PVLDGAAERGHLRRLPGPAGPDPSGGLLHALRTAPGAREGDRSPASRRLAAPAVPGVVRGLLVVAWTFLTGVTGWYRTPSSLSLFWVVIALQAIVIVATLWRTRPGRSYGQQVGTGLIASAVASVFVFVGSFVFTTVAFP